MLRRVIAGGVGAIVGSIVGFAVGAMVGGNFMADLELTGARGYEATGPLGALAGLVIGAVSATAIAARA